MTVHEELARVEGVRVDLVQSAFVLLLAVVVALMMKVVGMLLITALLIIPAAAARRFARSPEAMAAAAALLGLRRRRRRALGLPALGHARGPFGRRRRGGALRVERGGPGAAPGLTAAGAASRARLVGDPGFDRPAHVRLRSQQHSFQLRGSATPSNPSRTRRYMPGRWTGLVVTARQR